MTSPSAAHTGHVPGVAASLQAHGQFPAPHLLMATAELLVDAGHASWCPVCGGTGQVITGWRQDADGPVSVTPTITATYATCTRCRGGRLNPFHGCTFTTTDPCACTTRCSVYRPTETPTP